MNNYLFTASLLVLITGVIHSISGEILLLRKMKNENLPLLFGKQLLTKRTIRLVWHILTVFAALIGTSLLYLARLEHPDEKSVLFIALTAATMFACFLISFTLSRGQHLSWIAFLAIGVLCILGI